MSNLSETPMATQSVWAAVVRGLCPRCRKGSIFQSLFGMNAFCPSCQLKLEREYGYFTGAMYFSYAMGIPLIGFLTLALYQFFQTWPLSLGIAWLFFLPLTPWIFRYSRIFWIHFDRWIHPGNV